MNVVALIGVSFTLSSIFVVNSNRRDSRRNIHCITNTASAHQTENKRMALDTPDYARKLMESDDAWRNRETRVQEEWLDRPWYRQLLPPPFPHYMDLLD